MRAAYSFVIPFLNERETLRPLFDQIAASVRPLLLPGETFEVVFVDDGSTDDSVAQIEALHEVHPEVILVELRGNFGKSAALAAGFEEASGRIIFTLDADLQDDPKEIPRFVEALAGGLDMVSGYKLKRHDPWHKVLPSRAFNFMVRLLTGVALHDVNCGFKAYRAEVVRNVRLYGELHRFIPVLAKLRRFRIGEMVVEHHPRRHGQSKFGAGRFFRGLMDLFTVSFLLRYERRPSHFFGFAGGLMMLAGGAICTYLTALKVAGEAIGHRPLLVLGILLIVVGFQALSTGLIAELLVHLQSGTRPYVLRRVLRGAAAKTDKSLRTGALESLP